MSRRYIAVPAKGSLERNLDRIRQGILNHRDLPRRYPIMRYEQGARK